MFTNLAYHQLINFILQLLELAISLLKFKSVPKSVILFEKSIQKFLKVYKIRFKIYVGTSKL